jgi:hypothetical protein
MIKKTRALTMVLGLALGPLVGCGGEEDEAAAEAEAEEMANALGEALQGAADEAAAEAEAEEAEGGDLALESMGLQIAAPAGSSVRDAIVGEGYMVQGPGLVLTVAAATDSDPADLAAAKEDNEMYSPENIGEEELEDGYILTFTNSGGMGDNYWVVGRREIGDTVVMCKTTASQEAQQTAAVAACKSIHD